MADEEIKTPTETQSQIESEYIKKLKVEFAELQLQKENFIDRINKIDNAMHQIRLELFKQA